jgi:hypothetical protein
MAADPKVPVALAPDEELASLVWWKARSTYFMAFGTLGAAIRLANTFGYAPFGMTDFDVDGATNAFMDILTPALFALAYRERLNPKRKIAFVR